MSQGFMKKVNPGTLFLVLVIMSQVALIPWVLSWPESANAEVKAESKGPTETSFVNGETAGQVMVTGILDKVIPIGVGPNGGHVLMLTFVDGFTLVCWGEGYSSFKVGKSNHIIVSPEGRITIDWPR